MEGSVVKHGVALFVNLEESTGQKVKWHDFARMVEGAGFLLELREACPELSEHPDVTDLKAC
jgi:hypothetical protein